MAATEALRMPAKVVFETAPDVLAETAPMLGVANGEVDLAGCSEFDSSLIAVLLELSRRAGAISPSRPALRLRNVPPNLRKLAALYGVQELLFERD